MAEETGTTGGSEFPVFKSGAGAFDRAKYEKQESELVQNGQIVPGKEIDEDLRKQKGSVDKVALEANKFYNDSYQKAIKEIDPGIDTNSIYYKEAYSSADADKRKIRRNLEKGETVDGKEIFEMSKESAKNKLKNAATLKNGKLTEIVENLGIKAIKDFESYEDVKNDFDSKIKDDKLKFDPLLSKMEGILSYFNDNSPGASQNFSRLYTPENNALLSALAKILEDQGFTNDSVLNASKAYKDNLQKLSEKSGSIEEKTTNEQKGATGATGATGTTEEKKLETKIEEEKKGATGPQESANLPGTTGAVSASTGPTGPSSTATTTETKLEELKSGTTGGTGGTGGTAIDKSKTTEAKNAPAKKVDSNVEKAQNDLLALLGIKIPEKKKEGEGEKEGEKEGKKKSATESAQDKLLEDLGFKKSEKTEDKSKSSKETKETKLEEKVSKNNEPKSETSSVSAPIKETTTQNLSSVVTPEPTKTEASATTSQTNTTSASTSNVGTTESKTTETETKKEEENKKTEEKTTSKEKESTENNDMKMVINLLTQLNNTMQSPLIVIPNDKKFG